MVIPLMDLEFLIFIAMISIVNMNKMLDIGSPCLAPLSTLKKSERLPALFILALK